MGHEVEKAAIERGHKVLFKIDRPDDWKETSKYIDKSDVVIDFSLPQSAVDNILFCFEHDIPIVSGTTGWYNRLDEIIKMCSSGEKTLFVAPNFSIGVNVLFALNKQLANIMNDLEAYDVLIEETHHKHKLDAPSGTAIQLAGDIIESLYRKSQWAGNESNDPDILSVFSIRKDEIPGIHEVIYDSGTDRLSIKHEARSRKGFAQGAVIAAEWVQGKRGYFEMKDLLKI